MKPAESAATRWAWAGSTHTPVRLSWLTLTSASSCASLTFHRRRQPSALTAAKTYGSRLPTKTTCSVTESLHEASTMPSDACSAALEATANLKVDCCQGREGGLSLKARSGGQWVGGGVGYRGGEEGSRSGYQQDLWGAGGN